jgi:EAL domain-containing protein (putative c-di-GMP-specific phosphodiesterase class I)
MPAALDRDEFTLAYQPIVALRDGSLRGVEALAHWHHPSLGLLSHDRFVDLAEDTGLIVRLGLRLLENACRQAAAWQQKSRHAPFISINVGRRQMRHPGLAADVTAVLDRTRLPPHQLQLEITESAVMTSDDATAGALHALADLGVHIAIDEFGTGYGNLATLHELPIHGLKLAGSFARCLRSPAAADPAAENLLATLISLGHALGLTVTADGVETAAQVRRLAVLGCDLGQGGYLGLPTTADEIA